MIYQRIKSTVAALRTPKESVEEKEALRHALAEVDAARQMERTALRFAKGVAWIIAIALVGWVALELF